MYPYEISRMLDLRVHVRAVHVYLPAVLVHDGADLANLLFEHAVGGGIRDHQRGQRIAMLRRAGAQIRKIHVAVRIARHYDNLHSRHRRARGVGAVG